MQVLTLEFVPDQCAEIVSRLIEMLIDHRKKAGISQQKLSQLAGLSRTGIRHIESGEFKPTLYSLLKVSEALKVDLPKLLDAAIAAGAQTHKEDSGK